MKILTDVDSSRSMIYFYVFRILNEENIKLSKAQKTNPVFIRLVNFYTLLVFKIID